MRRFDLIGANTAVHSRRSLTQQCFSSPFAGITINSIRVVHSEAHTLHGVKGSGLRKKRIACAQKVMFPEADLCQIGKSVSENCVFKVHPISVVETAYAPTCALVRLRI